jgi:hypothetical protein
MSISGFNMDQLRARLRDMSDDELVRFGKAARSMTCPWLGSV